MLLQRLILKSDFLQKKVPCFKVQGQIAVLENKDFWYEVFGDKNNPAILLLMGGGCQGVMWTEFFCNSLASLGFYVIRFDQRDTGLSFYCKEPYSLLDMAQDAVSLLDYLDIRQAYFMGTSMGGAIAQIIAAHFSSYVIGLILLSTTKDFYPVAAAMQGDFSSKFSLSSPDPEWFSWMKEAEKIPLYALKKRFQKHLDGWRILNGTKTAFPEEYYGDLLLQSIRRQRSYKVLSHHKNALLSSLELVHKTQGAIHVPVLIIHGGADPLFPKDHASALASSIPSSRLVFIEEMGHNLCPCFHQQILREVALFCNPSPQCTA